MPQNNPNVGDWIVSTGDGGLAEPSHARIQDESSEVFNSASASTEDRMRMILEMLERDRGPQIQPTPDSEPMVFRRHPRTLEETDALEELIMADMARPKAHDEEAVRKLMKKRHLIKPERDQLHNPEPDFIESSRGEACRSACTLDVSDIIIKHKLK